MKSVSYGDFRNYGFTFPLCLPLACSVVNLAELGVLLDPRGFDLGDLAGLGCGQEVAPVHEFAITGHSQLLTAQSDQ